MATIVQMLMLSCLVSASGPTDREQLQRRILEEERDREIRVVGLARARLSFPQQVSAGIGAIVASQPRSYDCFTVCEFRGFQFQAEPGIAGGQISAGYAVVLGETGRGDGFLNKVYLAYGVRGAWLRTWGDADLRPAEQTRLGVEGDLTVIGVNFSLGVFRDTGAARGDDWIVTGGVGWGF